MESAQKGKKFAPRREEGFIIQGNEQEVTKVFPLHFYATDIVYFPFQDISNKTKELLNNLKSLATEDEDGKAYITLESLKERKMPPATENFLFSLAACEGLVKL